MIPSQDAMELGLSTQQTSEKSTCLLVVGMHRSGTSALTRVLSLLGADLPQTLMQGTNANKASNATGHWESEAAARMGDAILDSAGTDWSDPEPVAASWYRSARYRDMRDRAVALLQEEYGSSPLFVFKDPRVCRLLPFWLNVLERFGATPKIVSILRSPLEVAASLQVRNGFELSTGQLLWLRYVLDGEYDSRGMRRVFTTYDQILKDAGKVAEQIGSSLNLIWPRASSKTDNAIASFLSSEHRHHSKELGGQSGSGRRLIPLLTGVYETLTGWATGGEKVDDYPLLDRSRQELNQALSLLGDPVQACLVQSGQIRRFKVNGKELEARLKAAEEKAEEKTAAVQSQRDSKGEALLAEARDSVARVARLEEKLLETQADHEKVLAARAELLTDARISMARFEEKFFASRADHEKALSDLAEIQKRLDEALVAKEALLAELHHAQLQNARSETHLSVAEEKIKEQRDAIEELKSARAAIAQLEGELTAQMRNALEADMINAKALQQRESELAELHADHLRLTVNRDALSTEAEDVRQTAQVLQAHLAEQTRHMSDHARTAAQHATRIAALQADLDGAVARDATHVGELENARRSILDLEQKLAVQASIAAQRQSAVLHLRQDRARKVSERDVRNHKLAEQVRALEEQLALAYNPQPKPKRISLLRAYLEQIFGGAGWRAAQRRAQHLRLLRSSTLFVPWWYLSKYEDVQLHRLDPAEHYLDHGGKEGRMPGPDFDGRWYLENHPDVRAAGVNPLIHYLEHGQLEGRAIRSWRESKRRDAPVLAEPVLKARQGTPAQQSPVLRSDPAKAPQVASTELRQPKAAMWKARPLTFSGLGRHADLNIPAAASSTPIPFGHFAAGDKDAACSWLVALGKLDPGTTPFACAAPLSQAMRVHLCADRVRIADAWLEQPAEIRLRIEGTPDSPALILQAYQLDDGENISPCGEPGRLSAGQTIIRLPLHSPYRPIALVLTDSDGNFVNSTLMPFPSLHRGGAHFGELAPLPVGSSVVEAVHALGTKLLQRYVAVRDGASRWALSSIIVDVSGANGTEPLLGADMLNWLTHDLGLAVTTLDSSDAASQAIAAQITAAGKGTLSRTEAAKLSIPACAIPTLSALFSLSDEMKNGTCRAIHMDLVKKYAAYSLVGGDLPELEFLSDVPRRASLPKVEGATDTGAQINSPLAIYWPTSPDAAPLSPFFPIAAAADLPFTRRDNADRRLSVIIDCKDGGIDLMPLLVSIERLSASFTMECILVTSPQAHAPVVPFDLRMDIRAVTSVAAYPIGRFIDASRTSEAERILLLDETVLLHDPRTVGALWESCGVHGVGSASCMLVSEKALSKGKMQTGKTAGWIVLAEPNGETRVARPDVTRHDLPALIATVAPDLQCAMLTRAVLQDMSDCDEVTLGLGMHKKGLAAVCLTCFTATSKQPGPSEVGSQPSAIPPHALRIQRLFK